MVATYFEQRRRRINEIEHRNKDIEAVIKSLSLVEQAAASAPIQAVDVSTCEYAQDLRDWYDEQYRLKHEKYLAVQVQREKMQLIHAYLTCYRSLFQSIFAMNLFVAEPHLDLSLPDPKQNLKAYIDALVNQIITNESADGIEIQRQLYLSGAITIIAGALFTISLSTLISIVGGPTIGLVLMLISSIALTFLGAMNLSMTLEHSDHYQWINTIKNDGLPDISRRRIALGHFDSQVNGRGILLYWDDYAKKIMCSIVEPAGYKQSFALTLADTTQNNELEDIVKSNTLSSLADPGLKEAVYTAIKNRPFSRVSPDSSGYWAKHPPFAHIISGDRNALQNRFFTDPSNAFGVQVVQNKIHEAARPTL